MANLYSLSSNAADLGQPIVPLYTDYVVGGTYGGIDDAARVTWDGNDPDAARGLSSMRVTWNGTGPNGYFQFGLGTSHSNRPRNIPQEFGQALQVRFMAKGDTNSQQIRVNVYRTTADGGFQRTAVASQVINLSKQWVDYVINLPPGLAPSDLHAVQFIMGSGLNAGNRTFRLDEVRISTEGFDPLRLFQSYVPGFWAPSSSSPATIQGRDVWIYPYRAFLYDNALGIKALLATGDPAAQQTAREIADALIATQRSDGSYYNGQISGHVLNGDGTPRTALTKQQTLGDNSWVGLALLDVYRASGEFEYLQRARAISDWAEVNFKATGPLKGYRGGFDAVGVPLPWRATEHNIDFFALNEQLAEELRLRGMDTEAATYASRAAHAGDFVIAMFDATGGKFWTGTGVGDALNTSAVPLDAQLWSILALSTSAEYAGAIDWNRPLAWAESHLHNVDGLYQGFTFSDQTTPNRVWFEGVAHGAVVYQTLGDAAKFDASFQTLETARLAHVNGNGQGIVAASRDGIEDPFLGANYDARLHLGTTAWSYFAAMGINPFRSVFSVPGSAPQNQPVEAFASPVADSTAPQNGASLLPLAYDDQPSPVPQDSDSLDMAGDSAESDELVIIAGRTGDSRQFLSELEGILSDIAGDVSDTWADDLLGDLLPDGTELLPV
jgi:hypothetical protein